MALRVPDNFRLCAALDAGAEAATFELSPQGAEAGAPGAPQGVQAAAEGGKPALATFRMVAYTGAAINVGWGYPVVVALDGLDAGNGKSRPILLGHDPRLIVGHTTELAVEAGKLKLRGVVSATTEAAREVVEAARNGFPWQASIGAAPEKVVFVPEGSEGDANGRKWAGPVYIVQRARLGEISFVPVGADGRTSANVAAAASGGGTVAVDVLEVRAMTWEQWVKARGLDLAALDAAKVDALKAEFAKETAAVQASAAPAEPAPAAPATMDTATVNAAAAAAVKAERERVAAIRAAFAGEHDALRVQAEAEGWDMTRVNAELVKAIRAGRPTTGPAVHVRADGPGNVKVLEAGLCARVGLNIEKAGYDAPTLDAANRYRSTSLPELFALCAAMEGKSVYGSFGNETIRAGFSTVSLPGLLNNVAGKALMASFMEQAPVAPRLCTAADLTDFKEAERYRLNDTGDLAPVAPDGELKHGGLSEDKATNQIDTWGKIFALTRKMIYNDDLSAFTDIPRKMGARAARLVDVLFFNRLLANPTQGDGKTLFHADHGNYISGADTVLSINSISTAVTMFEKQTDGEGKPIAISPRFLLVPSDLKMTAREILKSTAVTAVGATDATRIPTYNPVADEGLELVSTPYLNNAGFTGGSAVAWYLFANPSMADTFEIGYLRGARTPTVEQSAVDFDNLGIRFRVYWDLGVREQDWRGVFKSKGAA